MPQVPLALLLLRASRWFDRQLLAGLAQRGWPTLSPAQSLVFAYLDPSGTTPAELARRLGQSRQATQQLVQGLVAHDLLALIPNPARRGGLLIRLTDRGRALAEDASQLFQSLEEQLGAGPVEALRLHLDRFHGPEPPPALAAPPGEGGDDADTARSASRPSDSR